MKALTTELPQPGEITIWDDTFHFSIAHAVTMGSNDICYTSDAFRAQIVARALKGWLATDDGKQWWQELLDQEGYLGKPKKDIKCPKCKIVIGPCWAGGPCPGCEHPLARQGFSG